jgi:hypothetical protein
VVQNLGLVSNSLNLQTKKICGNLHSFVHLAILVLSCFKFSSDEFPTSVALGRVILPQPFTINLSVQKNQYEGLNLQVRY